MGQPTVLSGSRVYLGGLGSVSVTPKSGCEDFCRDNAEWLLPPGQEVSEWGMRHLGVSSHRDKPPRVQVWVWGL